MVYWNAAFLFFYLETVTVLFTNLFSGLLSSFQTTNIACRCDHCPREKWEMFPTWGMGNSHG